ncbi:MAG: aminopeptidase [Methylocystaceae bacterium]
MADDRNKHLAWLRLDKGEEKALEALNQDYLKYLNQVKTERESMAYTEDLAGQHGFKDFTKVKKLKAGDKVYIKDKGKVISLIVVGKRPLSEGVNIVAAHADAPRIDLKPNPLYEGDNMALMKTHYYGGIKKYQWTTMPLALHGVFYRGDGSCLDVVIGENEDDPVFTISDLLPHLAKEQMEKKMSEAISGEALNILAGSKPAAGEDKDTFLTNLRQILSELYGLEDEDFASAEVEMVPVHKAREVGLDRSMIGGYGQDDRVSVFTGLKAILEVKNPSRTSIMVCIDKEEIGSVGNTGLDSLYLENLVVKLAEKLGITSYPEVRQALMNSAALSADVNAAIDPNYPDAFDKRNDSFLGQGVVVTKYTGSRGKSESNDANPEFVSRIRRLFNENNVVWQVGELGKVDIGGGGTVAMFMARYGMDVLDCGVALLSMHAPYEVASKVDVYEAYKGYKVFFQHYDY